MRTRSRLGLTAFGCDEDERDLFRFYATAHDVDIHVVDEPVAPENAHLAHMSSCISVSHKNFLSKVVLRELKRNGVELVTTRSIGTNHIDLSEASRLGIVVENTFYLPDSVADYAMMLILMALRNAKDILERAGSGDFSLVGSRAPDLSEMTVGVIGNGRIGQEVIKRLTAFGCRILVYRSENMKDPAHLPFEELIKQCDILTFHLPLTAQTRYILNRDNIHKVKPGAYIINTGRGGLIETGALLEALKTNRISGAALDVIEGEEDIFYRKHSNMNIENEAFLQLSSMPNVIITPHTAYYTKQALIDTVKNTILKCLEYERSKRWIS